MPSAIPRPCKKAGCPATTTCAHGYCIAHKSLAAGWADYQKKKGSARKRGYGSFWEKLRKLVIRRDKGLCQECLRNGRTAAGKDVDHIVPKSQGGTNKLTNLELLCRPCHKVKTQRESAEGRGGVKTSDLFGSERSG